jgi:hypothetical protein
MSGVIDSPGPDITVAGRYKVHKVETLSKTRQRVKTGWYPVYASVGIHSERNVKCLLK